MRTGLVGWIVVGIATLALVVMLDPARVGLSTYTPFAQLIALRGWLALGAAGVGVCALIGAGLIRHRGEALPTRTATMAAIAFVIAISHVAVLASRGFDATSALPADKPEHAIDVLTFNTLGAAPGVDAIADLINAHQPDVVALPETSEQAASSIAARTTTKYTLFMGYGDSGESDPTALLVSTGLGAYERIDGPDIAYGMVGARPVSGDGPVLYAVHATSPVGARMPAWRSDLKLLSELCSATPNVIMAGDFNATMDHQPLRDTTCVDASAGTGGAGTWPQSMPRWLSAHIDHVLVDDQAWTPTDAALIDNTGLANPPSPGTSGSDHRALLVRLVPAPQ